MQELYIGLMTGTSIDGIDGVLVSIDTFNHHMHILANDNLDFTHELSSKLHGLTKENDVCDRVDCMAQCANELAHLEAKVVHNLLKKAQVKATDICAIGSHGQTIRHRPQLHYSVQIDNGPLLAYLTKIDSITNFRAADLAALGEGAPLTQIFHQHIFSHPDKIRLVLNLGGISNLTLIDDQGKIICAYDVGPANTLIDYICRKYLSQEYDIDGACAFKGKVRHDDLALLLKHPYLKRPLPKSTGREEFNSKCIEHILNKIDPHQAQSIYDAIATVSQFTLDCLQLSFAHILAPYKDKSKELLVCGGGAYNKYLMQGLQKIGKTYNMQVASTKDYGVHPKYIEAQAFAYFAYCTTHAIALDLRSTTGSTSPNILGSISPAQNGHYKNKLAN